MEYFKKAIPALIVLAVIIIALVAWKKYEKENGKTTVNTTPGAPFYGDLPTMVETGILGAPEMM